MTNLIWIIILLVILSIALIVVGVKATKPTVEELLDISEIEAEIIEREFEKELKKIEERR